MDFNRLCINCMKEKPQGEAVCPFCGFDESCYQKPAYVLDPRTVLKGKFLIGKLIDRGGFGIMYKAFDMNLEHTIAIKEYYIREVMFRDTAKSDQITVSWENETQKKLYEINKEKFEKEAKTLGALSDLPGIVQVRDFFNELGTSYIAMEYLPGDTLREYVRKNGGRLTAAETRDKILPVMISLEYVHEKNVLHRDISPDNIKIQETEFAGTSVKLFDFGGARTEVKSAEDPLSVMILKKDGYTPIEQIAGSNNQGPWTDVYALAATIYFCLCGKAPADANERASDPACFRTPSQLGIPISGKVQDVLLKGLALQPADRYQSVAEFRDALEAAGWGDEADGSIQEDIPSIEPSVSQPPALEPSVSQPPSGSSQPSYGAGEAKRPLRDRFPVFAAMIVSLLLGIGFLVAGLLCPDTGKAGRSAKQVVTQGEDQKAGTGTEPKGHLRQKLGGLEETSEKESEAVEGGTRAPFNLRMLLLCISIFWFVLSVVFLIWWLIRRRISPAGEDAKHRPDRPGKKDSSSVSTGGRENRRNDRPHPKNRKEQPVRQGGKAGPGKGGQKGTSGTRIPSGGSVAGNYPVQNYPGWQKQRDDQRRAQEREAERRRREEAARQRRLEAEKKKRSVVPELLHLTRYNDLVQAVLPLTLQEIVIGTSQNNVNYLVTGNNRVSRRHAMVTYEQGLYYLTDLRSTNGTFLNGTRVISGKKYLLHPGDQIALFNERFVFVVRAGNARTIPGMTFRWRR